MRRLKMRLMRRLKLRLMAPYYLFMDLGVAELPGGRAVLAAVVILLFLLVAAVWLIHLL